MPGGVGGNRAIGVDRPAAIERQNGIELAHFHIERGMIAEEYRADWRR